MASVKTLNGFFSIDGSETYEIPPIPERDEAIGRLHISINKILRDHLKIRWLYNPRSNVSLIRKGFKTVSMGDKAENKNREALLMWIRQNVLVEEIVKTGERSSRPISISDQKAKAMFSALDTINSDDSIDHYGPLYEYLCEVIEWGREQVQKGEWPPVVRGVKLSLEDAMSYFFDVEENIHHKDYPKYFSERVWLTFLARALMPGIKSKLHYNIGGESGAGKTDAWRYMFLTELLHRTLFDTIDMDTYKNARDPNRKKREDFAHLAVACMDELKGMISIGEEGFKAYTEETEISARSAYGYEPYATRMKCIKCGTFNFDKTTTSEVYHSGQVAADRNETILVKAKRGVDKDGNEYIKDKSEGVEYDPLFRIPLDDGFTLKVANLTRDGLIALGIMKLESLVKAVYSEWNSSITVDGEKDPLGGFWFDNKARTTISVETTPKEFRQSKRLTNRVIQFAQAYEMSVIIYDLINNILFDEDSVPKSQSRENPQSPYYTLKANTKEKWCFEKGLIKKTICDLMGIKNPKPAELTRAVKELEDAGFKSKKVSTTKGRGATTAFVPPIYVRVIKSGEVILRTARESTVLGYLRETVSLFGAEDCQLTVSEKNEIIKLFVREIQINCKWHMSIIAKEIEAIRSDPPLHIEGSSEDDGTLPSVEWVKNCVPSEESRSLPAVSQFISMDNAKKYGTTLKEDDIHSWVQNNVDRELNPVQKQEVRSIAHKYRTQPNSHSADEWIDQITSALSLSIFEISKFRDWFNSQNDQKSL